MQEKLYNSKKSTNVDVESFSLNADVSNNQENNGIKSPSAPNNTPINKSFVTRLNDERLREKLTAMTRFKL